jgi:hypothetical protein
MFTERIIYELKIQQKAKSDHFADIAKQKSAYKKYEI